MKKNQKFEELYSIANFDYASLYPESFDIGERLAAELRRKITKNERLKKLEKLNNIKWKK